MTTFTVKIHSVVDPRGHARSIEADSSAVALKLALADFERLYPSADVREISVSVMRKADFDAACQKETDSGPRLYDYATGDYLRAATADELTQSVAQAQKDGGAGVILVDGRRVYAQE